MENGQEMLSSAALRLTRSLNSANAAMTELVVSEMAEVRTGSGSESLLLSPSEATMTNSDEILSPAARQLTPNSTHEKMEELVVKEMADVSVVSKTHSPDPLSSDALPFKRDWTLRLHSNEPTLRSVFFARPADSDAQWAICSVTLTTPEDQSRYQLPGRFLADGLQFDVEETKSHPSPPFIYTIKVGLDTGPSGDSSQMLACDFGKTQCLGVPFTLHSQDDHNLAQPEWETEPGKEKNPTAAMPSGSTLVIENTSEDDESLQQHHNRIGDKGPRKPPNGRSSLSLNPFSPKFVPTGGPHRRPPPLQEYRVMVDRGNGMLAETWLPSELIEPFLIDKDLLRSPSSVRSQNSCSTQGSMIDGYPMGGADMNGYEGMAAMAATGAPLYPFQSMIPFQYPMLGPYNLPLPFGCNPIAIPPGPYPFPPPFYPPGNANLPSLLDSSFPPPPDFRLLHRTSSSRSSTLSSHRDDQHSSSSKKKPTPPPSPTTTPSPPTIENNIENFPPLSR